MGLAKARGWFDDPLFYTAMSCLAAIFWARVAMSRGHGEALVGKSLGKLLVWSLSCSSYA